jgi:hypothetical protein
MKTRIFLLCFAASVFAPALRAAEQTPANPLIDYPGFQKLVEETGPEREARRLSEDAFLEMMRRPGVVLLDARTDFRYRSLHIDGAINLPFTEFTAASLAAVIPSFDAPVLIYCNNNFADEPWAFASKLPVASLNLSTYTSLRAYGYTRIYELGPLLKVAESRLPLVGEIVAVTASGRLERRPVNTGGASGRFDPGVVAQRALAGARDAVSPAGTFAAPSP